jgi:hypothetical protein
MFDQAAASLDQPLLQARQRPVVDSFGHRASPAAVSALYVV